MDAIAPARRPPVVRGDRPLEADLLRCVAMLSVVALHADAWMGHDGAFAAAVYPAFDRFLRFCVPVFAFLTGYVLTGTSGDRPLDWPSFARGTCTSSRVTASCRAGGRTPRCVTSARRRTRWPAATSWPSSAMRCWRTG